MIAGRPFGPGDGAESRRVFIVNESLARTLYGPDAVGQQLRLTNGMVGTVVGVVGDVRLRDFTEAPDHAVYFPVAQFGFPQFAILVRTSRAVEDTAAVIRGGLAELAPGIPAYDVQPMDYWLEQSVSDARIRTWALGLFGAAAIVLSVLGLYGVLSYVVALRYRELGIRMAVGARPIHLIASVVGEGLRMAVVGVAIGLGGAALASTGFEALLFGVTPGDPVTFLAVAGFVTAIALLASLVPALRASRADPLVALRGE
jgi:hypothetical protein